jgi:hypothetical protein
MAHGYIIHPYKALSQIIWIEGPHLKADGGITNERRNGRID